MSANWMAPRAFRGRSNRAHALRGGRAVATELISGAVGAAAALYPGIPVEARKAPLPREGDPAPIFIVSCAEEAVEDLWAGVVLKTYPLTIAYSITNVPTGWSEAPDVRAVRQAVSRRVLGSAWVHGTKNGWDPAVNDVDLAPKAPYQPGPDKRQTISVLTFLIQTLEPRTG